MLILYLTMKIVILFDIILYSNKENNIGVKIMENVSYKQSQSNFIAKTLLNMGLGLLITYLIAIVTPFVLPNISGGVMLAAFAAELGLVLFLRTRVRKMAPAVARIWFLVYAAVNGFTLSIVFTLYDFKSLSIVFLITAFMFFCSSMIGITSKRDLSVVAQFFMMMLIGLVIIAVIEIFMPLPALNLAISVIGIVTFCGLTAYDIQKIKYFHSECYNFAPEDVSRFVIISALELYLDFINLFLYVLRLLRNK